MAGEVSCRAIRPLFRYMNERALPLPDLLADLSLDDRFVFSPENWLPAARFSQLLDRAILLSGDPDLVAHIGESAAEPCPFGPLSPQAVLTGSPEALFAQAGDFLGLLQREGQVIVSTCQAGQVVIECVPPPGEHREHHVCTYARHLLMAIPRLWHFDKVQIRETRCAVRPGELRFSGTHCALDRDGTVWEVFGQGATATRLRLGELAEDGTLFLDGTLYGTDRCSYEITWPAPRPGWRQSLARFSPASLLAQPLFRQAQHYKQVIQSLREQLRSLSLTMEARILERTENLRLRARQAALVEQASRRFAAMLDPAALFGEVVRSLHTEFGYYAAALYLLEGEVWNLRALDTADETGQQQLGYQVRALPAAVEEARRAVRPLAQNDLAEQPHPLGLPCLGRARSSLTAPLIASDRLLGVLDLQSPRPGRFDQDDALLLHSLATQAAITLERSLLYQEEQRARQRADAMAVLAQVVNTSLELDRALSLALDQVRRVLPYDAAAIVLLQETQRVLAASAGLPPHAEQALSDLFDPEQRGPLARTFQNMEPLLLTSPDRTGTAFPGLLAGFSSWLAIPLASRGTVMGAFVLAAHQAEAYSKQDLRTAEDLAGQVATAIENARLYELVRRDRDRLETLYRTAQELNADLVIEEVLRHILDLAQTSVAADGGTIILLDNAGRPSHSILLRPRESVPKLLHEVLTRGAAGWVVREQKGLMVHDTATDPRWLILPDDPTRSAIVVPLIGQGRVIGVLTVMHSQIGHFDAHDLDLLSSIAGQASTVVQRAHLFAAIRDERARLEAVIEGTADAVIVLDEAGHVFRINRSAAELFGLPTSTPGGAGDSSLDRVLQHPALQTLLGTASGLGQRKRSEVPLPDGRTFYATLTPIPGVGAVITMQDITYLKDLDRMKSDFVATVSHDLRTPLGALQGFAEMLELAGPLNEDQARFAQRIIHSVDAMTSLVEGLLDLARIEAGVDIEMAPCQIAAVIAESVDQLTGPAALRGVSLQADVPDDLPLVWGNGRRLGQVINNLLDNAIKYVPERGHVRLRASPCEGGVQVDISDNGTGIPAADLPHVFEKFYRGRQTGEQAQGTGLGLSIVRSIIQAHNGSIWVESKEGEETTFSFRIPRWTE